MSVAVQKNRVGVAVHLAEENRVLMADTAYWEEDAELTIQLRAWPRPGLRCAGLGLRRAQSRRSSSRRTLPSAPQPRR